MSPDEEDGGKRGWRLVGRTRRHTYYAPATNLPGKALFLLIGALGLVALAHAIRGHGAGHSDLVLGIVGLACLALSVWQVGSLSR